jgi:hypothetical protein
MVCLSPRAGIYGVSQPQSRYLWCASAPEQVFMVCLSPRAGIYGVPKPQNRYLWCASTPKQVFTVYLDSRAGFYGVPQPLSRYLYKTYCNLHCFKRANIRRIIKSIMISVFMCYTWEERDGYRIF